MVAMSDFPWFRLASVLEKKKLARSSFSAVQQLRYRLSNCGFPGSCGTVQPQDQRIAPNIVMYPVEDLREHRDSGVWVALGWVEPFARVVEGTRCNFFVKKFQTYAKEVDEDVVDVSNNI